MPRMWELISAPSKKMSDASQVDAADEVQPQVHQGEVLRADHQPPRAGDEDLAWAGELDEQAEVERDDIQPVHLERRAEHVHSALVREQLPHFAEQSWRVAGGVVGEQHVARCAAHETLAQTIEVGASVDADEASEPRDREPEADLDAGRRQPEPDDGDERDVSAWELLVDPVREGADAEDLQAQCAAVLARPESCEVAAARDGTCCQRQTDARGLDHARVARHPPPHPDPGTADGRLERAELGACVEAEDRAESDLLGDECDLDAHEHVIDPESGTGTAEHEAEVFAETPCRGSGRPRLCRPAARVLPEGTTQRRGHRRSATPAAAAPC